MMAMRITALMLPILLLACGGAMGEELSSGIQDQQEVQVTVYNSNLGLVKDVREVRFPVGTNVLRFADVASAIDPTSVHIKSLNEPGGLSVLEQNYEYDLISHQKLMEKYVGKKIKLIMRGENLEEKAVDAKLISTANGNVFEIDGELHLGFNGRVVLPELPENLVDRPTLFWLLKNRTAKAHRMEVSYLTGGMNWRSDYVMVLDKKDQKGDFNGWVTINNTSGATYNNAALKLVAGEIHRAEQAERLALDTMRMAKAEESPQFAEEAFFEYHLYTLERKTTLKNNQTKQVSLLSADAVPVRKLFVVDGGGGGYWFSRRYNQVQKQDVGVFVEIRNDKESGLGIALPKGIVRVFKKDSAGQLQFVGEDNIDHTPRDEKVKLKIGTAFDIVAERKQTDFRKISRNVYESAYEVVLRNHKDEAVTVAVDEIINGDWEILQQSHSHQKVTAFLVRFPVKVTRRRGHVELPGEGPILTNAFGIADRILWAAIQPSPGE